MMLEKKLKDTRKIIMIKKDKILFTKKQDKKN